MAAAKEDWMTIISEHIEILRNKPLTNESKLSSEFLAKELYEIVAMSKESDSGALKEMWKLSNSTHAAKIAIREELQEPETANKQTRQELSALQFELRTIADRLKKQEECIQAVFISQSDLAEKSVKQHEEHKAEIKDLKDKIAALTHSNQTVRTIQPEESISPKEKVQKKYSNFEIEFEVPLKRSATSKPMSKMKQRKIDEIQPQQLLHWDKNTKRFKGDLTKMKYIELTWPLSFTAAELALRCAIANDATAGYKSLEFR